MFALPGLILLIPIELDGTPGFEHPYLTDESRQPIQFEGAAKSVDKKLAGGNTRRQIIKPNLSNVTITWDNVAWSKDQTVDGYYGAFEIISIVQTGGLLKMGIWYGEGLDALSSPCFCTNYNYEIVHRRGHYTNWRFKISITLEQTEVA